MVHTIRYYYDGEGNLTRKVISPVDGEAQTIYYENGENNTVVKFSAGGQTVTSHSKTDSFGRKVFDELQLGTGFLSREFSYHKGEVTEAHAENGKLKSSPTTQLVSKILLSDGRTLSYEYDAEERITKVTDSTLGETVYTYDALGQLLTERHNGQVVNSMEYDNYGNILSKNGVAYVYGNATWKDLLTTVNGQLIEYDAQGNPTNYLGHTLTWEKGRQLKSFDGNTYTYNANGIRTSKTVNGIKHTYTLDGTKILRETWGSNTLVPLYDNEDRVCGILYNSVPYYFLKNLQGDVIAIVDKNAQTVAEYSYDAWGVPEIKLDSSDCQIATINPFRYRGYYYDTEIAKYYLQSRYYDASVGRFVNGDSFELMLIKYSLASANLLFYCHNDPINHTDASGNVVFTTIVKCILGAIFGLLVQLTSDLIEYAVNKYVLGRSVAKEFAPSSPAGDYIGSAVSWALSAITPFSKIQKIVLPLIPVGIKHVTNLLNNKFKLRDCLIDIGYALLTAIVSIALSDSASKKLNQLRKYRKKNSSNLALKATKKQIKYALNLKITKVSITLTSLDAVTVLIFSILFPTTEN